MMTRTCLLGTWKAFVGLGLGLGLGLELWKGLFDLVDASLAMIHQLTPIELQEETPSLRIRIRIRIRI